MTIIKNLTNEQVAHLQNLLDRKQYPEAYNYLRDISYSSDTRVSKWFDIASHINADDGSFYSDFVRSATIEAGLDAGTPINLSQFQNASDKLAEKVISEVINNRGVSNIDTIISEDVKSVVLDLGINIEGWAGTAIGGLPAIFGGIDLGYNSEFYRELYNNWKDRGIDNFFEKIPVWADILENNLIGLRDAIFNNFGDFLNNIEDFVQDFLDKVISGITDVSGKITLDLLLLLQSVAGINPFLRVDPLTLDLDGDGVELVSLNNSTAFFDLDADGFRENVGWVKSDDALLVYDANNSGSVDNIDELFGDSNVTGTAELATYDVNTDGLIDKNDAIFSKLQLWQDYDQDGLSDEGELKSLADYNIVSIDVNPNNLVIENKESQGNLIISSSTYKYTKKEEVTTIKVDENGNQTTTTTIQDVIKTNILSNLDLAIDQANSQSYSYYDNQGNLIDYTINPDTLFLPQSRGYRL